MNLNQARRSPRSAGPLARTAAWWRSLVGPLLRLTLLLALASPLWAAAQAFRCTDPASGQVVYTDQDCEGGILVVPERSVEQRRLDAQRAQSARMRQLQRERELLQAQQRRLTRQNQARAREQALPPERSAACAWAREHAVQLAGRDTASAEQQRTARANAALACGQPPPSEEITIVRPEPAPWRQRPRWPWWGHRPVHEYPGAHRPGRYTAPEAPPAPAIGLQPPIQRELNPPLAPLR